MRNADVADGDRDGATPARSPPQAAADGEYERLRRLLLGDELDAIEALDARLDALDRKQGELPARLPEAILRAQDGAGSERITAALARPVAGALGTAVRENRQVIVDVLFPVIGPAIRKAIAEALRALVADLNRALESSFTPRGIRWRIEAWRSGVPYAEIVLKHTLRYGIDHVFLIERDSGLVLDRESAPHLPALDADAIAGMLTAIGEFVRDSVGQDESGTLDAARVGEHLLWVVQGPRANLACFIHGVPPARLRALLEQRLEAIHAEYGEIESARVDAADEWRHSLRPEALMRAASAGDEAATPRASRWPIALVALAALALIAWAVVRERREASVLTHLRAELSSHPGFVLTGIDAGRDAWIVHGLVDPDAEPIAPLVSRTPHRVTLDASGYLSTDDTIVARRARRLLDAPSTVTTSVRGGALSLGGRAPGEWIAAARERSSWVPGVRTVDFAVAPELDAAASARDALSEIAHSMPERIVTFMRDTEPAPESGAILDAIVADATRADALGRTAGVPVAWIAYGTNDDPGSEEVNAHVRAERAQWLVDALRARGIANVAIAPDDPLLADAHRRGAFVRLADLPR
jgi:hypothetical protein